MKIGWILPDRRQTGTLSIDWGNRISPLHQEFDLRTIPRAFTLGIPEEVIARTAEKARIFSQVARLDEGGALFAGSIEAGTDDGGRVVVLTLIAQLHNNETLTADCARQIFVPASEKEYGEKLREVLSKDLLSQDSDLSSMLVAVKQFPLLRTFASERLVRTANPPDWMKKKIFGNGHCAG